MLVAGPIKSAVLIENVSQLGLPLGQGAEVAGARADYEQGSSPGVRSVADGQIPTPHQGDLYSTSGLPTFRPCGLQYHSHPPIHQPYHRFPVPSPASSPQNFPSFPGQGCFPLRSTWLWYSFFSSRLPLSHWVAQAKGRLVRGEALAISQIRLALSGLPLPREL